MMVNNDINIVKNVDFVLKLIDDYDLSKPKGKLVFVLNDRVVIPIVKNSGTYIFVNLELNSQVNILYIKSDYYFSREIIISLNFNALFDMSVLKLKPKYIYPYFKKGTIIKFTTFNKHKETVASSICSYIDDKNNYDARIIDNVNGKFLIKGAYEEYLFGNKYITQKEKLIESNVISLYEKGIYIISTADSKLLDIGDKLYNATFTTTDENGNGVVYFNNFIKNKININIVLKSFDLIKEVSMQIEENKIYNLGSLYF
ncbi:hypothetical protein [Helicovermis profundi]|uniref:Uncharacterized protein n=1 Tax=Helicovermis profundi TaxID=3065157 RepID=A0AAU9ELU2_9FIRM|nr:hypothetical protein HLPR_13550 [Clostridia bacterium S502]